MDVSVSFKGGGSFVKIKPVFSTGGENVFVASKNSVFQYNTKTGKLIFEFKGWTEDIVGLNFNIIDNLECITACSKGGQIIVWKITNRVKLLEVEIPKRNVKFFTLISWNLTKGLKGLIVYKTKQGRVAFSIINTKSVDKQVVALKLPKNQYVLDVCQDKYFSVVMRNAIYFFNLRTFRQSKCHIAENNRKFTCVACHPEEETVLTGDDTGRIVLWGNIFGTKTQAVFHWHTLPVKCIAFSTLGSYFYSGADESVLVKWQIDNPNQKQFLPRLPGGIVQLTVSDNNAYIALATSDNAVRIVNSQMNQISLIQHLVLGNQFECGIIYDPITRTLVMNGNVGCVQFYSPNDMSLLYNVDIVNQNKLSNERECNLENTDVKKLALSKSGKWLATIEERKEFKLCKEIRLKFWSFNSEKQTYELNTSIEFPHESSVSNIEMQRLSVEDHLVCITVGCDKMFKIWQVFEVATVHKTGPVWECVSVGTFRDMKCQGLSFAMDGSLFATAFGAILTIWATGSCELKSSLIHSNFKQKIKCIQFGKGNQCHLIATAGKAQLSVWNILTLTMTWVVSLNNVHLLVSDPLSTYMLVICDDRKNQKVVVFEPSAPDILFSSRQLIGPQHKIIAATFVPSMYSNDTRLQWFERANLYFTTSKGELYCISKGDGLYEYVDDDYTEDLSEEASVFSKLKPQVRTSQVKLAAKHHMFPKTTSGYRSYRQYIEAPIETLPPIRLLAVSLLKSLVLQRENVPEKGEG